MQPGDKVVVTSSVIVYNHPQHRGEAFDMKGSEGDVSTCSRNGKGVRSARRFRDRGLRSLQGPLPRRRTSVRLLKAAEEDAFLPIHIQQTQLDRFVRRVGTARPQKSG